MLAGLSVRETAPKLLVIDDLADRTHQADLLLDQNFFGEATHQRYQGLVPPQCRQLLGPDYALLGPEYAQLQQLVRAFLAAPWLPGDEKAAAARTPPPHGWAFPVAGDPLEEGEEPETDEDEGVMLSQSASAITAKRLQQLADAHDEVDEALLEAVVGRRRLAAALH